MSRRPTIVDVARHAGVSKSTVSLVLQNSPLVRQRTREEVEHSIGALNYVYNRAAANLRGAGTGLIGLVINDLRNPFFTEFAASAQMAFAQRGYATVIANTDEDPATQTQVIEAMIEHGVSALLISPAYCDEPRALQPLAQAGIPTLQVLRMVDDRTELFPFASMDYARGGHLATRHLRDLGASRIAFVGGLAHRPVTLERMSGYLKVMTADGLAPLALHGRPSRSFGRSIAATLAAQHPEVEAVVAFSDLVALGMLSGFAEQGIRLGNDIRLVGFDDIEEASLVFPQLSSIRCDARGFGESSAQAMLAWITEGKRPPSIRRSPVDLIARASSLGTAHSTELGLSSVR